MAFRDNGHERILLQRNSLKIRRNREPGEAAVSPSLLNPPLNLLVIPKKELIVNGRVVLLEFPDDIRQPVRGRASMRIMPDLRPFRLSACIMSFLQPFTTSRAQGSSISPSDVSVTPFLSRSRSDRSSSFSRSAIILLMADWE